MNRGGLIKRVYISCLLKWGHHEPLVLILTEWGRVTHICVSELTIIGSDNGLSPDRRQVIIWTNAGILSIGPLRTHFSEILIETLTFSSKKISLKVSSAKGWPFCLGFYVLKWQPLLELGLIDITVTSQWPRWRLKSPAPLLCTQLFVKAQVKENTKARRHLPLWGEFIVNRWIPLTKGQ